MVTAYCVAITDDEYYNTGLEVVACENDQDPDKSQESILARLGSDERGGYPLPYECAMDQAQGAAPHLCVRESRSSTTPASI